VTTAIFGLAGVIVGALVTGGMTLYLERRREAQSRRAALHVMDVELLRANAYIESVLEDGVWAAGTDTTVGAWERYEDVLARDLRRDDFHFVALAVTAAERAPMLFAQQVSDGQLAIALSDNDREALEAIRRNIKRGQTILGRRLGEWPRETRQEPPAIGKA
jgi:hypothetical protein